MAYQAQFRHGDPRMEDYTPSGAVAAGDVIVTNDTPRIAHRSIAAGVKDALAANGGVYQVTADGAIAANKKVYWDGTAHKVTLTSTANKGFGETVTAAAADGDLIDVLHRPF